MYQNKLPISYVHLLIERHLQQIAPYGLHLVFVEPEEISKGQFPSIIKPAFYGLRILFGQFHTSIRPNRTQHTGERIYRHCLVVPQQVYHIGPLGHIQQDFEPVRATVDHVTQDIERIMRAKADFAQQVNVFVITAVNVRHSIDHFSSSYLLPRTYSPSFLSKSLKCNAFLIPSIKEPLPLKVCCQHTNLNFPLVFSNAS